MNFCFCCRSVANVVVFCEQPNDVFVCGDFSLIEVMAADCVILSVDSAATVPLPSCCSCVIMMSCYNFKKVAE